MALKIYLLGTPRILLDGQELNVSRRKSRAILYYLAAQDQPVPRESLLSIFWIDLPRPTAQQTLRTTLHGLRRSLGDGLDVQGDRVGLSGEAWVDTRLFEQRLSTLPIATGDLTQALDLYRGEFLEGFSLAGVQPFEDWLTVSREHYRRLALRGWSALAAEYEARGEYRRALDCLERALTVERLQEDLQRDAIRLLVLAGDRPAAIRRYDELRRLLDEELGVPPMLETRRLYDDILNDRLAAPPPVLPPAPPPARLTSGLRAALLPVRTIAPPPAAELPFAGRSAELEALREITASGRLALIEGEPGVGKTRLAEQFLDACREQDDSLPLVCRGRELEGALPYLPLIEALRGLLDRPEWETLRAEVLPRVPAVWLAEAARLAPELGASRPEGAPPPAADEARLWEGLRQFLSVVGQVCPLVMLIDDLHWLDAATLGLLAYLLRHTGGELRFLATLRAGDQRKPVVTFLQSLTRDDRLRRLSLARLSPEDVLAVAQQLSPDGAQPLAAWLFATSEGNAYILSELVRYARRSGVLGADGRLDLSALPADPVVPQTVFSLIQARLDALSEESRRVLDAAVAQGRDFEFPVVAHAAGLSEGAALDALDELQSAGLVRPTHESWFRFDHPLTMEVAYQQVGELRHRHMHRRVAESLEQLYLDHPESVAGQLAWHFFEGNAPQRSARYALQAAEQAGRLAAWNESIDFLEMALKGLSGAARLPALIQLGQTHGRAGHFARAAEVLRDALHLAGGLNAPRSQLDQIRLEMARNLLTQARFPEVIELAQQVAQPEDTAGSPENRISAELIWGTALSVEGANLQAAAEHLRRAQELWFSQRGGDPATLAQVQFELGSVAAQQGDLEPAVEFYRQSLATAAQAESDRAVEVRLLSYNNLAYHLHLLGDPTAAQYARQGLQLAQERGIFGFLTYLYSTLGEIHLAAGELEAAETQFNAGLELAERFQAQERIAGLTANLGQLALRRGQTALAIHQLSKALGLADAIGTRHLAAQIRIWLAPLLPPDEARRRLSEARLFAESSGRKRLVEEVEKVEKEL